MNRKKFLWLSLAGAGGLLTSFDYVSQVTNMQQVISSVILKNLDGLKVNPEDIQNYAKEVVDTNTLNLSFVSTQLLCVYQMRAIDPMFLPFGRKYRQLCTDITAGFLLSTDFFLNKMDEEKEIKMTGRIYTPYTSACANPCSGLYYK